MIYLTLKLIHLISAAVLLGTGAGIAFFMQRALLRALSGDLAGARQIAADVVLADWLFTTTAIIVQPVTGVALMWILGMSWHSLWFLSVAGLYLAIGACWLPVVYVQLAIRRELDQSAPDMTRIDRLYRIWFWLGVPAFSMLLGIYGIMVWRSVLL